MTDASSTRQHVEELLRRQRGSEERGTTDELEILCRAASDELVLLGAATTLVPSLGSHVVSAASSQATRNLEEAQFGVGEGPTRDAFAVRRPVLVPDLDDVGPVRWPGWAPVPAAAGAGAVYALPLLVGATGFGVLTLYAGRALDAAGVRTALMFAEVATGIMLDDSLPDGARRLAGHMDVALDLHAHVFQAQGMMMVALGVTLAEALSLMRAHAWATGQDLSTLAREIVAGRASLPRDDW